MIMFFLLHEYEYMHIIDFVFLFVCYYYDEQKREREWESEREYLKCTIATRWMSNCKSKYTWIGYWSWVYSLTPTKLSTYDENWDWEKRELKKENQKVVQIYDIFIKFYF